MRAPLVPVALALVLLPPSVALAVDKCKVKLDAKNGNLLVSAGAVTGTLRFGPNPGAVSQTFFNAATCVVAGKAKNCLLADPTTVAARTPPPDCMIHLADDVLSTCSAWIKGCTPGSRTLATPVSCARVVNGITIFDACP